MTLQRCVAAPPKPVPQALTGNTSPLDWQEWSRALAAHPDRRFAEYVSSGVRDGFRVGYDYSNTCAVAARNMQSARDHPEVVRVYLEDERAKGRVLGPFQPDEVHGVHTSRFGVIPKRGQNKWRLILDLSSRPKRQRRHPTRPLLALIHLGRRRGSGSR